VHIAVFGATLLFLLSTWYLVHAWLNLVIEGWLSPWDVVPVRPPQGTWERSLNDFFNPFPAISCLISSSWSQVLWCSCAGLSPDAIGT
jgi:hypothetical protein